MITGRVPREMLDPECSPRADPLPSAEDAELAKWKAVELFKVTDTFYHSHPLCILSCSVQITVNFLQVTAVAIAVNVKWTLTLITLFETAGERAVAVLPAELTNAWRVP